MTEAVVAYRAGSQAEPLDPLPRRAINLARAALKREAECGGRGRVSISLIMTDGVWFIEDAPPVKVERLGE